MKRYSAIALIALFATIFMLIGSVQASSYQPHSSGQTETTPAPAPEVLIPGAILYDRWYAALGKVAPSGDMPIWSRQSTNTRSGPDTWRCVECHGWDYKGVEGAYASGSHKTGFPNVRKLVADMSVVEIMAHLHGSKDPAHDFSQYMDDATLNQLAQFLKYGLIDDDQYIDDVSLKVKGANLDHGKQLYDQSCAACHGVDGKLIVFNKEGPDEYLGSVANQDPWRFLHRTRFGVAGTDMPVGAKMGWTAEDGRDVLAYAQKLPVGLPTPSPEPASANETPQILRGGPPSKTIFGGIFTGLGSILLICFGSVVFLGILVAIGALIVSALRKR